MFASEQDIIAGALNINERLMNVPEKNLQIFLAKCLKLNQTERETYLGLLEHDFLNE